MSVHDFATVRAFETNGMLEMSFQRGDEVDMRVARSFKGRWDPDRKVWRIDPKYAGADIATIIATLRDAILDAAPAPWRDALPGLVRAATTTRRFKLVLGAGGARVHVPSGHRLEYALKAMTGAVRDGQEWVIPAAFCADQGAKDVINNLRREDKAALGKMLDYMGGFGLAGKLNLVEEEADQMGLKQGAVVFGLPAFVQKADPSVGREALIEYPLKVVSVKPCDVGLEVVLAFVTGVDAWQALLARYAAPIEARSPPLDARHAWFFKTPEGVIKDKWSRRRV